MGSLFIDDKSLLALRIGLFQASECLILLIQPRMDRGDVEPGDVASPPSLLQFVQHLARLGGLACTCVGVSQPTLVIGDTWGQGCSSL